MTFGEKAGITGAAPPSDGRARRLRWQMLDRATSSLDMNTLAVLAPIKTVLHAFKGNRYTIHMHGTTERLEHVNNLRHKIHVSSIVLCGNAML